MKNGPRADLTINKKHPGPGSYLESNFVSQNPQHSFPKSARGGFKKENILNYNKESLVGPGVFFESFRLFYKKNFIIRLIISKIRIFIKAKVLLCMENILVCN